MEACHLESRQGCRQRSRVGQPESTAVAAEMVATEAVAVETTTTTMTGTTDAEDGRAALAVVLQVDQVNQAGQVDLAAKDGAKEKANNHQQRGGFHLRPGRLAPACASGTGSGSSSSGGR